jgi:hypothetical protein
MHTVVRFIAALAGVAAIGLAAGSAAGQPASSPFVPHSAEEALRELRHTQASAYGWAAFGDFSSVHLNHKSRDESGVLREHSGSALLHRNDNGTVEVEVLSDEGKSERVPANFDMPELDAAKAKYIKTETVLVANKRHTCKVYEFVIETNALDETLITRRRYWLTGGVPTGVVQAESNQIASGEEVKPSGHSRTWLADAGVMLTVAGKPLRCYCYETDTELVEGDGEKDRSCSHPSIPGGMVRYEERSLVHGRETSSSVTEIDEVDARPLDGSGVMYTDEYGCSMPAWLLNDAAVGRIRSGDYKGAIADFDSILAVDPTCSLAYDNRGVAKAGLQDVQGALRDYNRAIALAPGYRDPYRNRALLKSDRRDFKGALEDLNVAVSLSSGYTRAQVLADRAVVYMMLFQDNKALKDYSAALKLKPQERETLDGMIEKARRSRKRE